MKRLVACGVAALIALAALTSASIGADSEDETPAPFAPLEPLVGSWKGTAVPAANKLKGWPETHSWAWKFSKGTPVGMTVAIEGGKVFTKGDLTFDAAKKKYTIKAVDASGKPATYVGGLSKDGKSFVFDRSESTADGKERLTVRPNGIRYVMTFDHQAPGAPQYKKAIETGLTKEGESFAAGGGGADLPKCILTGGSASMTVTYNGKSYPVCCTGCRDEFNENPEKYAARAAAKALANPEKTATPAKAMPKTSGGDSEFGGLVDTPKEKTSSKTKSNAKGKAAADDDDDKPAAKTKGSADDRSARDLNLAKAFEKSGNTKQALNYYKDIVKKYPKSDAAKTAAERIKVLEKD